MIPLTIIFIGKGEDGPWRDLQDKPIIHLGNGTKAIQIGVLEGGMTSGLPSVALRIDLPDGQTVIAETSARLFVSAGNAVQARYPDLLEGD
jgi:hypothetical protein